MSSTKASMFIVALLLFGAVLVAGCTSASQPSPLPTMIPATPTPAATAQPSASASPSDVEQYFEQLMITQESMTIIQPLTHSINSIGNDVYSGVVARGTDKYNVKIETPPTAQNTLERGNAYIADFKANGYVTTDSTSDYWIGFKGQKEAEVMTDTMDGYIMVFETA